MSFIIFVLISMLIIYLSQVNYRKIYLAFKVPGPFPLPFLGNALLFFNKTSLEIWRIADKLADKYQGSAVRVWICSDVGICLMDPNDIQVLLTSPKLLAKSEPYKFLKPWLNDGLLLSAGSKWHQRRKLITPAFHFKALENYSKIFNRHSAIFVDILSKYKPNDKVELLHLLDLLTLDVTCEAAMGIEMNSLREENSEYVNAVQVMNRVVHLRTVSSWAGIEFLFKRSNLFKEQTKALNILHGFAERVIQTRREKLIGQRNDPNYVVDDETLHTNTFLDILLHANVDGKPLSNLDIREEVNTFMFAGHDTSKSLLSFCFFVLAKHSDVQQKCFQEVRDFIGDDCSKAVSFSDLNKLQYLELVIKETLRLYPTIPILGRLTHEDVTIGRYTYPKGASIAFSPVKLGRNPKLFKDPLEFRPERFLDDVTNKKFVFSYLPFSAGSRNCIGQKFAMLKVKTVISKVLRHFEVSLAEDSMSDPVCIGEVVLTTADKIHYHLKPRLYTK